MVAGWRDDPDRCGWNAPARARGRRRDGTIQIVSDSLKTAFFASWSPDGEWIVFSGRASKSVDLYVVRADGTDLRQVTDTPMGQLEEAADWAVAAP